MIQARALAETRRVCPALLGRLSWLVAVALALTLYGCGEAWSPTASSTDPREQHVLGETARFAVLLSVHVEGRLTDDVYSCTAPNGTPTVAAGWYSRGVAWYYRPYLLTKDLTYGTELAAHEVCHALEPVHNERHEACMKQLMAGK